MNNGGDVNIRAGDGSAHGNGGNIEITGGTTIKAGDGGSMLLVHPAPSATKPKRWWLRLAESIVARILVGLIVSVISLYLGLR